MRELANTACGDGLLGYGDDKVRVSWVWEERTSIMASEVSMDKDMCKGQTVESPGSAKMQAKEKNG